MQQLIAITLFGHPAQVLDRLRPLEAVSAFARIGQLVTGYPTARLTSAQIGQPMSLQTAKDIGLRGCLREARRGISDSAMDSIRRHMSPALNVIPVLVDLEGAEGEPAAVTAVAIQQATWILQGLMVGTPLNDGPRRLCEVVSIAPLTHVLQEDAHQLMARVAAKMAFVLQRDCDPSGQLTVRIDDTQLMVLPAGEVDEDTFVIDHDWTYDKLQAHEFFQIVVAEMNCTREVQEPQPLAATAQPQLQQIGMH